MNYDNIIANVCEMFYWTIEQVVNLTETQIYLLLNAKNKQPKAKTEQKPKQRIDTLTKIKNKMKEYGRALTPVELDRLLMEKD